MFVSFSIHRSKHARWLAMLCIIVFSKVAGAELNFNFKREGLIWRIHDNAMTKGAMGWVELGSHLEVRPSTQVEIIALKPAFESIALDCKGKASTRLEVEIAETTYGKEGRFFGRLKPGLSNASQSRWRLKNQSKGQFESQWFHLKIFFDQEKGSDLSPFVRSQCRMLRSTRELSSENHRKALLETLDALPISALRKLFNVLGWQWVNRSEVQALEEGEENSKQSDIEKLDSSENTIRRMAKGLLPRRIPHARDDIPYMPHLFGEIDAGSYREPEEEHTFDILPGLSRITIELPWDQNSDQDNDVKDIAKFEEGQRLKLSLSEDGNDIWAEAYAIPHDDARGQSRDVPSSTDHDDQKIDLSSALKYREDKRRSEENNPTRLKLSFWIFSSVKKTFQLKSDQTIALRNRTFETRVLNRERFKDDELTLLVPHSTHSEEHIKKHHPIGSMHDVLIAQNKWSAFDALIPMMEASPMGQKASRQIWESHEYQQRAQPVDEASSYAQEFLVPFRPTYWRLLEGRFAKVSKFPRPYWMDLQSGKHQLALISKDEETLNPNVLRATEGSSKISLAYIGSPDTRLGAKAYARCRVRVNENLYVIEVKPDQVMRIPLQNNERSAEVEVFPECHFRAYQDVSYEEYLNTTKLFSRFTPDLLEPGESLRFHTTQRGIRTFALSVSTTTAESSNGLSIHIDKETQDYKLDVSESLLDVNDAVDGEGITIASLKGRAEEDIQEVKVMNTGAGSLAIAMSWIGYLENEAQPPNASDDVVQNSMTHSDLKLESELGQTKDPNTEEEKKFGSQSFENKLQPISFKIAEELSICAKESGARRLKDLLSKACIRNNERLKMFFLERFALYLGASSFGAAREDLSRLRSFPLTPKELFEVEDSFRSALARERLNKKRLWFSPSLLVDEESGRRLTQEALHLTNAPVQEDNLLHLLNRSLEFQRKHRDALAAKTYLKWLAMATSENIGRDNPFFEFGHELFVKAQQNGEEIDSELSESLIVNAMLYEKLSLGNSNLRSTEGNEEESLWRDVSANQPASSLLGPGQWRSVQSNYGAKVDFPMWKRPERRPSKWEVPFERSSYMRLRGGQARSWSMKRHGAQNLKMSFYWKAPRFEPGCEAVLRSEGENDRFFRPPAFSEPLLPVTIDLALAPGESEIYFGLDEACQKSQLNIQLAPQKHWRAPTYPANHSHVPREHHERERLKNYLSYRTLKGWRVDTTGLEFDSSGARLLEVLWTSTSERGEESALEMQLHSQSGDFLGAKKFYIAPSQLEEGHPEMHRIWIWSTHKQALRLSVQGQHSLVKVNARQTKTPSPKLARFWELQDDFEASSSIQKAQDGIETELEKRENRSSRSALQSDGDSDSNVLMSNDPLLDESRFWDPVTIKKKHRFRVGLGPNLRTQWSRGSNGRLKRIGLLSLPLMVNTTHVKHGTTFNWLSDLRFHLLGAPAHDHQLSWRQNWPLRIRSELKLRYAEQMRDGSGRRAMSTRLKVFRTWNARPWIRLKPSMTIYGRRLWQNDNLRIESDAVDTKVQPLFTNPDQWGVVGELDFQMRPLSWLEWGILGRVTMGPFTSLDFVDFADLRSRVWMGRQGLNVNLSGGIRNFFPNPWRDSFRLRGWANATLLLTGYGCSGWTLQPYAGLTWYSDSLNLAPSLGVQGVWGNADSCWATIEPLDSRLTRFHMGLPKTY